MHWLVAIITHDLHTYLLYCSYACMTSTELRVHNMHNSLNCYPPKLGEKDSERTLIVPIELRLSTKSYEIMYYQTVISIKWCSLTGKF